MMKPLRIIHAQAPIRVNDIGGWTDTWFAKKGNVLNLAVSPGVEVQVKVYENERREKKRVLVCAENYRESFRVDPENPCRGQHPLLQFTISSMPLPKEIKLEINLYSSIPAGISTGTSASVCVALLGALNLLTQRKYSWAEIASLAHRIETEKLRQQSGIQDQICAAKGGISFIHIYDYPKAHVQKVRVKTRTWNELNRRLYLVYLGKPHWSSALHEQVISLLEKGGPQFAQLEKMATLAQKAKSFLVAGDLESYGETMILNHECQRALFARLISKEADRIVDIAKSHKASGWKVNGAGGKGGSLTILACPDDKWRRQMIEKINSLGKGIRTIPVTLSPTGLVAWEAG